MDEVGSMQEQMGNVSRKMEIQKIQKKINSRENNINNCICPSSSINNDHFLPFLFQLLVHQFFSGAF